MRPSRRRSRLLARGLSAAACLSFSAPIAARSLDEVRTCLAANVPTQSSVVRASLESTHRGGSDYAHKAQISWRRPAEGGSQTLVCMSAPRDIRGLAILVHELAGGNAVWGYMPEESRVLRFNPREAARQSRIARTAIRYEDLRYLPLNLTRAEAEAEDAGVTTLGERTVTRVRLSLPPGDESPYARVAAAVDEESCVPLELHFYGTGGDLVKVVTADPASLGSEKSIHLARSIEVDDLAHGTVTTVRLEKVEIDVGLAESRFTPQSLERGRCPR